jgi:hypothetical protein
MAKRFGTRRSLKWAASVASCLLSNVCAQDPVFDQQFVDRAIVSAELSLLVKQESPVNPDALTYTFFDVAQDGGDNLAVVAKRNGICYAAYRGRVPGFFEDFFQRFMATFSFNLLYFSDVCSTLDCCSIRSNTQRDFISLKDEVGEMVDTCRATCGALTPCPLILTGHQQGSYSTYCLVVILGGASE